MNRHPQISKGIDWSVVWIYAILVTIGLLSIFAVQYRETDNILNVVMKGSKDYGKQVRWVVVCVVLAIVILITDSKFFTATANLQYAAGIFVLLLVFPLHARVKGTESIIRFGGFQLQPAELCKVFTLLALAKFISRQETDFSKPRSHIIAVGITLLPAAITYMQSEMGLALVYLSLFLAMYREGLPESYLVTFFSVIVLAVTSLLLPKLTVIVVFTGLLVLGVFLFWKMVMKRRGKLLKRLVVYYALSLLFMLVVVPFTMQFVLKPYQVERIYDALGKDNPYKKVNPLTPVKPGKKKDQESYNVKQSKIAIGSGGITGKGFLKNTQTRYDFVPEQHTDFIFCAIAEGFGLLGGLFMLGLYLVLLWRITVMAERQRSTFSRVYAYGVAAIIFFHILINLAMTMGLAPVIGIPLPFISYGGTSMITFTVLLFILVRLDADRQMVLR
jgi:rod shape determining protein RodA